MNKVVALTLLGALAVSGAARAGTADAQGSADRGKSGKMSDETATVYLLLRPLGSSWSDTPQKTWTSPPAIE